MANTKSALTIVMGAMTFGEEGKIQARVHDLKDVEAILDEFQAHGHTEVDTARVYCAGTSEEYLGKVNWQKRGLTMETKLFPYGGKGMLGDAGVITHKPEDLRKQLDLSLKALQTDSIDMFYLHGPDRATPYEDTLRGINDLYKEGKFKRFGISNYYSWEVAEMVMICRQNGWIQPTVYQGIYNAMHRGIEPELVPCLRKYGISFYAFNPLGGGFFSGRYTSKESASEPGSRFDPNHTQGKMYRGRYWHDEYFEALAIVEEACQTAGLTMAETALRWMTHHSALKREHGDAILIGASSLKHIKENLDDLEKGPLPEEVVAALDKAWLTVKPTKAANTYWH